MKKPLLCFITSLLLVLFFYAWFKLPRGSRPTLEMGITGKIATQVTLYAKNNGGIWPTNWLQLTNLADANRILFKRKGIVVPEAYAFLPTNILMTGNREGNLILIERKPSKASGSLGRYFVFKTLDDDFLEGAMSEDETQALLSQYGVKLSAPNPEEVRAARGAAKMERN